MNTSRSSSGKRKWENDEGERKKLAKRTRRSDFLDKDLLKKFGITRSVKVNLSRLPSDSSEWKKGDYLMQKHSRDRELRTQKSLLDYYKKIAKSNKYNAGDNRIRNENSDSKSSREVLSHQRNTDILFPKLQASKRTNNSPTVSVSHDGDSPTSPDRNSDNTTGSSINNLRNNFEAKSSSRNVEDDQDPLYIREERLRDVKENSSSIRSLRDVKNKTVDSVSLTNMEINVGAERFRDNSSRTESLRDLKENLKHSATNDKHAESLSSKDNIFRSTNKVKYADSGSLKDANKPLRIESLRDVKITEQMINTQSLRDLKNKTSNPTENMRDTKEISGNSHSFRITNQKCQNKNSNGKDAPIRVLSLKDFKETQTLTLSPRDFCDKKTHDVKKREPSLRDVKLISTTRTDNLLKGTLNQAHGLIKKETNNCAETNYLSFERRQSADSSETETNTTTTALEERHPADSTEKETDGTSATFKGRKTSSSEREVDNVPSTEDAADMVLVSNEEKRDAVRDDDSNEDPLSIKCTTDHLNINEDIQTIDYNTNKDKYGKTFNNQKNNDNIFDKENGKVKIVIKKEDDSENNMISKERDSKKDILSKKNDSDITVSSKENDLDSDIASSKENDLDVTVVKTEKNKDTDIIMSNDIDITYNRNESNKDKDNKNKEIDSDGTVLRKENDSDAAASSKESDSAVADISKENDCNKSVFNKEIDINNSGMNNDKILNKTTDSNKNNANKDSSSYELTRKDTDSEIYTIDTEISKIATEETVTDMDDVLDIIINKDKSDDKSEDKVTETSTTINKVTSNEEINIVSNGDKIVCPDTDNDSDVGDAACFDSISNNIETSESEVETEKKKVESESKNVEHENSEKTQTENENCDKDKAERARNDNTNENFKVHLTVNENCSENSSRVGTVISESLTNNSAFDKLHGGSEELSDTGAKCGLTESKASKNICKSNDSQIESSVKNSVSFAPTVTSSGKRSHEDTSVNTKHFKNDNFKTKPIPFMSKIEDTEFLRRNVFPNLKAAQNRFSEVFDDKRSRKRFKIKEERVEDCMYSCPKYSVLDTENLMHSYKNLVCGTCYKHVDVKFTSTMAVPDTEFQIRCGSCNHVKRFKRSRSCVSEIDFNVIGYDSLYLRLVFSCLDFGGGYSQLQSTCMALTIPQLNLKSYKKYCNYVINQSEIKLDTILKSAGEVVHHAYENIGVSGNEMGVKEIKVLFDSSWIKSGKNDKYGLVVVIDVMTGLVLDYHLMIRYCSKCCAMKKKKPKSFELWKVRHRKLGHCQVNCESAQEHMERDGALTMCLRSVLKHKLQYKSFSALTFDIEQGLAALSAMEDKSNSGTESNGNNPNCVNQIGERDKQVSNSAECFNGCPSQMDCDNQVENIGQDLLLEGNQVPVCSLEQFPHPLENAIGKTITTAESEKISDENQQELLESNLTTRELTLSEANNLTTLSECEKEVQELNEKSPNHVLEEINISLALDLGNIGAEDEGSESLNFVGGYLDGPGILAPPEDPNEWLVGHSLESDINEKESVNEIGDKLDAMDSMETDGNIFCNYNESELKIQTINTAVEQDSLVLSMDHDGESRQDISEDHNNSFNKDDLSMNYDENREMASLLASNVVDQEVTKDDETSDASKEHCFLGNQQGLDSEPSEQDKCNDFLNKEEHGNQITKNDKIISRLGEQESQSEKNQGEIIDNNLSEVNQEEIIHNLNKQNDQAIDKIIINPDSSRKSVLITEKDISAIIEERDLDVKVQILNTCDFQSLDKIESQTQNRTESDKNQRIEGNIENINGNEGKVEQSPNEAEVKKQTEGKGEQIDGIEESKSETVASSAEGACSSDPNNPKTVTSSAEGACSSDPNNPETAASSAEGACSSDPNKPETVASSAEGACSSDPNKPETAASSAEGACSSDPNKPETVASSAEGTCSSDPNNPETAASSAEGACSSDPNNPETVASSAEGACSSDPNNPKTVTSSAEGACSSDPNNPETVSSAEGTCSSDPNNPKTVTSSAEGACSSDPNNPETVSSAEGTCSSDPINPETVASSAEGACSSDPNNPETVANSAEGACSSDPNNPETAASSAGACSSDPNNPETVESSAEGACSSDPSNLETVAKSAEGGTCSVKPDKTQEQKMTDEDFSGTANGEHEKTNVFDALQKIKFETLRSNVLKNCNAPTPIQKEMIEFACNYAIIAHNVNIENYMGKTNSINIL